ncbi:hypothetical protein FC83_GL000235 [Agrilactobacillus composti DSM 18527 = JCM 14202]|uniref:Surface layer protein A domain-containing protein n=1 Tax=Agrilactobacillus composti DSM 18527 = JCM 14202 TaxID=1423734 RepID=X0PFE8_9LACO|nr:hypothetical protein [Agrilactobacillus composti]KRM32831.1 hypothetical protein FC83_GL000235 [Agrilactobacillus composti DSM 18527 = JCM 14202]GAF40639.1 hypothetical protein JCM14202_2545 [Agrilactobacillus composti DSM 18527 = JCM 14202]
MRVKRLLLTVLSGLALGIGYLAVTPNTAQAEVATQDTYYAYSTVATADGTWGANLFNGNDQNKVFQRVLPRGSQWQVFGFTKRADAFYFDVGNNQWIQGNQVRVPANSAADAGLDVAIKFGDTYGPYVFGYMADQSGNALLSGKWGSNYYIIRRNYQEHAYNNPVAITNYIVYQNGDTFDVGWNFY